MDRFALRYFAGRSRLPKFFADAVAQRAAGTKVVVLSPGEAFEDKDAY
jgi:hypothetical protein